MGAPPAEARGPWIQLQTFLTSWLVREQDWDQQVDEAHMLQQKRSCIHLRSRCVLTQQDPF